MNKNESKYFNTAIKMDEALIALLEKKEFAYITVKEICERAGVNRSTFYLHYENTSDLLKETTRYILDKHLAYYAAEVASVSLEYDTFAKKELIFVTAEYLTPYLTFIKENQRLFKVAVSRFNVMNFNDVYEKMFAHIFSPILARFRIPEEERRYVIKFYLTGIFAIVMEWLGKKCADDIGEIVRIVTNCVLGDGSIYGAPD